MSYWVTSQMKLSPLIFSILFAACCPSLAGQDERFVEVPWANDQTLIYDLRTVQMVQPGRFTIVHTLIDDAERMAFELNPHSPDDALSCAVRTPIQI